MKILDSQIEIASTSMMKANRFMPGYKSDPSDPLGVKKSIKAGIEAYEQSKWIKFDKDDASTWPPTSAYGNPVGVIGYSKNRFKGACTWIYFNKLWSVGSNNAGDRVPGFITHWQALPEFNYNGEKQ